MTDATQKGERESLLIDGRHYWQQQTKDSFTSSPDSIGDPRGTVKPTSQLWMGDGLNECGEQKRRAIQFTTVDIDYYVALLRYNPIKFLRTFIL